MADRLAPRPAVPAMTKWGRLLCLAAVLMLLGLGFRGPQALAAGPSIDSSSPGVTTTPASAGPALAGNGVPSVPGVLSDRMTTEARHLRTVPPAPDGGPWYPQSGRSVPAGDHGTLPHSSSELGDGSAAGPSVCRGPPGGCAAL